MQGSEFRVQGSGFRVQGSGFRVQGAGCRVQGSSCRVHGAGGQGAGGRGQGTGPTLSPTKHVQERESNQLGARSVVTLADPNRASARSECDPRKVQGN